MAKRDIRIIDAEELLRKSGSEIPGPEVLRHWAEEVSADVPLEERLKWGRRSVTSAESLRDKDVKPTVGEFRLQTERLFIQQSTIMTRRLGIDPDFSTR